MITFIITRQHGTNFAVWNPFLSIDKATTFVDRHVAFRVKAGAKVQTDYKFDPAPVIEGTKVRVGGSENHPVLIDAPELMCVIREVTILSEDDCNERVIYRITRGPIQE